MWYQSVGFIQFVITHVHENTHGITIADVSCDRPLSGGICSVYFAREIHCLEDSVVCFPSVVFPQSAPAEAGYVCVRDLLGLGLH